jgi:hypothetical protein
MFRPVRHSLTIAILLVIGVAGTAAAHECYVANRSDQGNTMAGSNSNAWLTIATLESAFDFVAEAVAGPELDADQKAWAVSQARAAGIPNTITIFVGNHTIADGTPAQARGTFDQKGIDYLEGAFPVLVGIYYAALAS